MGSQCRFAALGLLPAVLSVAAGVAGVGTAAAANAPPAILSVTVSPKQVPAAGANVVLTVRVRNAKTCTFLGQRAYGSPPTPLKTVTCASGRASVTAPKVVNTLFIPVQLAYVVRVRGAGPKTVQRTVLVAQAAAVRPSPTATLSISVGSVPAEGGAIRLTYSSTNATSCTLGASPSFWTGSNPTSVACNGTYDATLQQGSAQRQWTFTFAAANASGQTATATATLTQEAPLVPTATLSANATTVSSLGGTVTLTYSSTNATTCRLAVPALWSSYETVDCSGTYDLDVPASDFGQMLTITFTALNAVGQYASANASLAQFGASSNWSGYIVLSGATVITQMSGQWTVPTLDCSATPNAGASEWVGIGGAGGDTGVLLQTGVATDCVNGAQQNHGWWELLPAAEVPFRGFTVSAGDTIQATVYESSDGSAWETKVDDLTRGLSGVMVTGEGYGILVDGKTTFAVSGPAGVSYAGGYSAEWIVEAYESNGSQVDLADYGTVTFTNVAMGGSSISLTGDEGVELVLGDAVVSTPSAPSGSSFSVSYAG